jgi:hypothetical protein
MRTPPLASEEPPSPARATLLLALILLALTLLAPRLLPGTAEGPRRLLAQQLNLAIAWADMSLGLGPEAAGAARAVAADPSLRTAVGRQGARVLAAGGTPMERLDWAVRLGDRDLLQAAVEAAWCAPEAPVRARARAVAAEHRLAPAGPGGRSRPC